MDFSKIPDIDSLGDLKGKHVFMRADFNVPLEGESITSDQRIVAAMPTIQLLLGKGAKLILASHLGRPAGKGFEHKYSLAPVAKRLSELLGAEVPLLPDCVGDQTKKSVSGIHEGAAVLLENLRFHESEGKGSEEFGKQLASLADAYVNDAFGTCHRSDASMVWPAKLLPSAAGLLVKAEVDAIFAWLTGYDAAGLKIVLEDKRDFETFFAEAPRLNPDRELITGVVCGVRVEEVEEPLMREIRYLDKLIDELARGKAMEKILRVPSD